MQILPEVPSFGTQIARNIGSGLGQGINSGMDFASKLAMQRQKSQGDFASKLALHQAKNDIDQQAKRQEAEKGDQGFKDSLDWLDQNIEYTGPVAKFTKLAGIPGTEAFGKRAEFDAQGFWATDKAFTHFNKGQISREKLKVIQNDLAPRSDLTQKTNKARISALRRLSNLPSDIPSEVFDKQLQLEKKTLGKIEGSSSVGKKTERPPLSSFYG